MSTATAILAFEKQDNLSNPGAWAPPLNAALDRIDTSIAGEISITTASGDTNLTAVNFTNDQSRNPVIRISNGGSPIVGIVNVYTPRQREYIVSNETVSGAFAVNFGFNNANKITITRGCFARIKIMSGNNVIQVGPQMTIATGKIDPGSIATPPGDMLSTNNLSELTNKPLAFDTIKQAATTAYVGAVELATTAEAQAGVDTARAVVPAGLAAAISDAVTPLKTIDITVVIGDGINVISTGTKGYLPIDFSCTITGWKIVSDAVGSIVVDVWKKAGAVPADADRIAGSQKPNLGGAQLASDFSLGTWTTAVTAGDIFGFEVESCSGIKQVTLNIRATR